MKKLALIAALALLGSGCANMQGAKAPEMSATDAIAAAEAARKKAASVGYEWRDTGKMIDKAKKAAAANDEATAVKLAVRALHQSENALRQQAEQKEAVARY